MGIRASRRSEGTLRRVGDVVGASILLIAASPILALAALSVLIESGSPVFFGHVRLGWRARPFRCWKIRTMACDAEAQLKHDASLRNEYVENGFKLPASDDPRVTRVGRFLRRTYVDEIPQLLNVLAGTMSLVGPRPVVPEELSYYSPHAAELLDVKPGIFGAWTSRGRKRPRYPERADLEIEYVRTRSFRQDLIILARSIPVVLSGQEDG